MSIRLVVNADDLGLHPRIDEGIFKAQAEGVVTSASALAGGPNLAKALERAKATGLGVGAHLCLSTWLAPIAPSSKVRWLAPGGRFRKNWREFAQAWLAQLIPSEEVWREFRAQIQRIQEHGVKVDHLDTHQHLHLLPGMARIVEGLASELNLPIRWPAELPRLGWLRAPGAAAKTAVLSGLGLLRKSRGVMRVRGVGLFQAGGLSERRMLRLIDRLGEGDWELGCHPGYEPGVVEADPDWRYGWELELGALCSPRVRDRLAARKVELVKYADLQA